jgi:hypothetical protein
MEADREASLGFLTQRHGFGKHVRQVHGELLQSWRQTTVMVVVMVLK